MEKSKFISVKEAMDITGYSRVHVIRLINDGKIQAEKVGHTYMVDRNSLGGIYKEMTEADKKKVTEAVDRTFKEYGDVLKRLGKE
ncbi:MAG: helix-turn-helix domain-containing protein [bacterium]|nr:helix-turn-helix domain-containing protein [bacterium]